MPQSTPSPNPSPQGGGEQTARVAPECADFTETRSSLLLVGERHLIGRADVVLHHVLPIGTVHDLEQGAVDRLLERAVGRHGDGIFAHRQGVGQDLQLAPAVFLDHVAEDRLLVDQRVDIAALQRLARLDHERIVARRHLLQSEPLRSGAARDRRHARARQIVRPVDPSLEAADHERRRQRGGEQRDAEIAGEHPHQRHGAPVPADRDFVAIAGGGQRHRRPPHAVGNTLHRMRVEMLGILPALECPDERADDQQQRSQRCDGAEQLIGQEARQGREQAVLWLRAHGDAEAGGKIRMRVIEARFTLGRDRNGRERGIDPVVLDGVEQAGKIVVELAKLVGDVHFGGDRFPQIDTEAAPVPIIAAQHERRHPHGADHKLGRRRICRGLRRR